MMALPPLKAGVYRSWKKRLYLVLGYSQDANADSLCDYRETMDRVYRHNRGDEDGPNKPTPLGERLCVVYIALQPDASHEGPLFSHRDVDDFLAFIDPTDGSVVPRATVDACRGDVQQIMAHGYLPRFEYVGPQFTSQMLHDAVPE